MKISSCALAAVLGTALTAIFPMALSAAVTDGLVLHLNIAFAPCRKTLACPGYPPVSAR